MYPVIDGIFWAVGGTDHDCWSTEWLRYVGTALRDCPNCIMDLRGHGLCCFWVSFKSEVYLFRCAVGIVGTTLQLNHFQSLANTRSRSLYLSPRGDILLDKIKTGNTKEILINAIKSFQS